MLDVNYKIAKQGVVNQDEMVSVVKFFLKELKGVDVSITPPYAELSQHPIAQLRFKHMSDLLLKAYEMASRFTVILKEDPDRANELKKKFYG